MSMTNKYQYQESLSLQSPILLDENYKKAKVDKMLAVLKHARCLDVKAGVAVDVGCSIGFFTNALSPFFDMVYGLDIDEHALDSAKKNARENVSFQVADTLFLPFDDGSVDLIICNHVYEHVPDPEKLFSEIRRVLKSDGACYLGAASRLTLIEPHYHLPFLSWLPKWAANFYMRMAGKGDEYYENLRTLWGIRRLIAGFVVEDYTLKVVGNPDLFCMRDMMPVGSIIDKLPKWLWRFFYTVLPSYIFILRVAQRDE